jgi:predicted adenine nucleotide alpha hydrolase (AANH) superfamily ATPase
MSLLLHACCAPCLVYPAHVIETVGVDFTCYFFNPNIHPFREFKRRLDGVKSLTAERGIKLVYDADYGLKTFLRAVVFKESQRCRFCYHSRLVKTAQAAVDGNFEAFSSTLLYSKYQNHTTITQLGRQVESSHGIPFMYRDFRDGWQQGIDDSISSGLYRQSYCGCIYSEQERYDNKLKKRLKKEKKSNV